MDASDIGTLYTYYVRPGETFAFTGPAIGRVTGHPLAPTGLSATRGLASASIDLAWSPPATAASYTVWRATGLATAQFSPIVEILNPNILSFSDTNTLTSLQYFYYVTASNVYGAGAPSNSVEGWRAGLPRPPTISAVDGDAERPVRLSWPGVFQADSYDVERRATASPGALPVAFHVPAPPQSFHATWLDETGEVNLPYTYTVYAVNSFGRSLASTASGIRSNFPKAPTELTAGTGDRQDAIHITWEAPASGLSFRIFRSQSTNFATSAPINQVGVREFLDTTAAPATEYWYWVTAIDDNGQGPAAGPVFGWRQGLPQAATGLSGSTGKAGYVELTWSATFTADSYIVLRSLGNDVNSATSITEVTATDSSPSYQDWDATPQTTYTYWIRAASAVGTGAASASATGQASSIDLVATQGEFADRVELNWLVTAAASSFEIWRGQTSQFAAANKLGDVSIQQYVDTPPTGGQFYYYWVRIADNNARSSATAGWRGAPPIATTATASRGNASGITVTWGPLPASSYEVRRAAQADGSDAVAIGTASDASFTDNVAVGERFYYAVSGINEFGTGPTSPFVAGWSGGFLQPPTQISVSQGVADQVNLSWTTAEAALATEIWRSTTADFANSAEIAAVSDATVYADSGAVPGTRYWYRLRSSHIDDTSAYSAISEGSRPGTRPDGVTA